MNNSVRFLVQFVFAAVLLVQALSFSVRADSEERLLGNRINQIANAIDLDDRASLQQGIGAMRQLLRYVSDSYEVHWRLSELYSILGTYHVKDKKEKLRVFEESIRFGRKAAAINPNKPEGHYRYAISLGSWGLENGPLDSLHLVPVYLQTIEKCEQTAEHTFGWFTVYADCARIHGQLLFEIPRFPLSVGDINLAKAYLEEAIREQSDFVENYIQLAELVRKQGNVTEVASLIQTAKSLLMDQEKNGYQRYVQAGWQPYDVNKLRFYNKKAQTDIARFEVWLRR